MSGFIRRVVTGHDKRGKAIVISDEFAPAVKAMPLRPGHRSNDRNLDFDEAREVLKAAGNESASTFGTARRP